jgi:hypothetical protein
MGRVGGFQGQTHAYSVDLVEEGLSFPFLASRRPCSLVLKPIDIKQRPSLFGFDNFQRQ